MRSGLPLSPNEERYVLSEAMATENYGNPWAAPIRGRLDRARLADAIQQMCDRHEGRRTGYERGSDGHFTRYVEARARPDVRWVSMIGAPAAEVRRAIRAWFFERGDLSPPWLTRFLIIQTAEHEHLLGNYLHHAVNDAETHKAAICEVIDIYAGRAPQGPATQYSDLWQWDWRSSPAYRQGEAFWTARLGGVEDVGDLPHDGGDPAGEDRIGPVRLTLPPELATAAAGAAQSVGVSEFTLYYAVTQVLLTRLTGRPRVCTTFQSGGRRGVAGSEGVHGVFSNGLVLATEVDERQSIAVLAGRLRGEIRQALAHEAYPYHHVIQATGLRPRFGVNWYPDVAFPECPGLEFLQPEMDYGTWEYDLNIRFNRHLASGAMNLIIYFREDAISRARVAAAADQFAGLLAALAADVSAPIAATPSRALAPPDELPEPAAPLPAEGGEPIYAAFLRSVAATPQAIAVLAPGRSWTYAELERRSRATAAALRRAGVSPADRVAIVAERGADLVASLLAAARLGAVFTVLDSAYPQARLEAQIALAAPRVLLAAGGATAEDLARRLAAATSIPLADAAPPDADPQVAGLDSADAEAAAYILFTSGSTGGPKGVACSHVPLSRFCRWQAQAYGLHGGDRFALLAGLSHDPLLREVFTPLSLGAAIVIPDAGTIQAPGALATWVRKAGVTVAHLTPALGRVLLAGAARVRALPALGQVFWGGDILPPELVAEMRALAPGARQTNFYGATETPQAVAAFDCAGRSPRGAVPVGQGVNGAQLMVVDAARRPLGVGEVGEIAVRSNALSLGYVEAGRAPPGGPAETYYTGDRALHLPGGDVLLLGRIDDQVKVRGYRVELGEVTAALARHPALAQAAAIVVGEGPHRWIAAFAQARSGQRPTETELAGFLATRLPTYMLPRTVRVLAALPLSPNGKIDRAALSRLAEADLAAPAAAAKMTGKAAELAHRWRELLGDAPIGPAASFASLGGDSLSYVQVYLATEEVLGSVPTGWHLKSIAELAKSEARGHAFWSITDSAMLVRAAAIFLIVAGHLRLVSYGGGATNGLMLVSGFMFGNFQLAEAFARRSAAPILKGLRRLLVPTLLFSALLFATKAAMGRHPNLSVLFLYADFVDYSRVLDPRHGGNEIYLWFIDCMVQIMALLWLAALALQALGGFRWGRVRFVLAVFLAGCVGRFVAPILFTPHFLSRGALALTPVTHLPTTHLPTIMLGALIAMADTPRRRAVMLACLVGYAALTAHFYSPHGALILLAAAALMIFAPRLPLPKPLTAVALSLSGASLFIYLWHLPVARLLHAAHAPEWPVLNLAVALISGIGFWMAWVAASSFLARMFHQPAAAAAQPAL